jgi:hypothetical protein
MLTNAAQDLAQRAVTACGEQYGFDSMEAIRRLGLESVKLERKPSVKQQSQRVAKVKIVVAKPAFPLPFNGEFNDGYCYALRQNNGLYTQCQIGRKGDKHYCKSCQALADKSENGVPEYGTIQARLAADIFEYVDPKGRKPVAYTKVMKKYKINQEQVLEEAGKFNINIIDKHFVVADDAKRGRPKADKAPKEPKGAKGRPKKAKKVLQIEGDEDDLFAALVADANVEDDEEMVIAPKKKGQSEEEKEAERVAKEAEKALKEEQRLKEKAEKEAKLAAEKLEKEQKKEAERLAKEAKKLEEAEAKRLKEEQRLKEKAEKEAKLAAEKESKKTKKAPAAEPEDDGEPDVVKKIEFEGKMYLKSKKTGIIYDYNEYVKNGEQVVVGHWNDTKNKIEFEASTEESEEEYD